MKLHPDSLILGEGDEAEWRNLQKHRHSFLFAAWDVDHQVVSLHELRWTGASIARKPVATPRGMFGWVTCLQNSDTGAALPHRV